MIHCCKFINCCGCIFFQMVRLCQPNVLPHLAVQVLVVEQPEPLVRRQHPDQHRVVYEARRWSKNWQPVTLAAATDLHQIVRQWESVWAGKYNMISPQSMTQLERRRGCRIWWPTAGAIQSQPLEWNSQWINVKWKTKTETGLKKVCDCSVVLLADGNEEVPCY